MLQKIGRVKLCELAYQAKCVPHDFLVGHFSSFKPVRPEIKLRPTFQIFKLNYLHISKQIPIPINQNCRNQLVRSLEAPLVMSVIVLLGVLGMVYSMTCFESTFNISNICLFCSLEDGRKVAVGWFKATSKGKRASGTHKTEICQVSGSLSGWQKSKNLFLTWYRSR